jgi:hypothetical protein
VRRFWAVPCALAGVLLLASGVLAGLLFLFWAAVIAWPDLAFVTWPRHAENPPRSLRVPRLLAWPLAAILLCVLVISLGTIGYFLLGEGSLPGLVVRRSWPS